MGGHQVGEQGPNDDGYDEEGYDESQRAEILEVTRDGPTDGNLITDLAPDLGGEPLEDDGTDELPMTSDEIGEDDEDADDDEDDMDEDAAQADFENDDDDDDDGDGDELSDTDDVALKP